MEVERLTQICPLCRRPAGEDAALTRLCRDCRAMLDPILPRAGLVQPDYAVSLAGAGASQTAAMAAPLALDADFDDVSFAPDPDLSPGLSQDFALLDEAAADHFAARPAAGAPAEPDQPAFVHHINPLASEVHVVADPYEDDEMNIAVRSVLPESINPSPARSDHADIQAAHIQAEVNLNAEIETTEAAASSQHRAAHTRPELESRAAHAFAPDGEMESHG